jgi:hypothetical protein
MFVRFANIHGVLNVDCNSNKLNVFYILHKGYLFVLKPSLAAKTPRRLQRFTLYGTQLASNVASNSGVPSMFELRIKIHHSFHNVALEYERMKM